MREGVMREGVMREGMVIMDEGRGGNGGYCLKSEGSAGLLHHTAVGH